MKQEEPEQQSQIKLTNSPLRNKKPYFDCYKQGLRDAIKGIQGSIDKFEIVMESVKPRYGERGVPYFKGYGAWDENVMYTERWKQTRGRDSGV